jgi:hypothetical protein
MSDSEVLRRLSGAGLELSGLNEAQREVLEALSPQEAEVLVDVLRRLEEVGPEVTAHSVGATGGAFW